MEHTTISTTMCSTSFKDRKAVMLSSQVMSIQYSHSCL
jgi:hypothetical protein